MSLDKRCNFLVSLLAGCLVFSPLALRGNGDREENETEIEEVSAGFGPVITSFNWGTIGSAVLGTSESLAAYSGAELFAGPLKFASLGDNNYFHGVLPNGRIVKPAGDSTQVGMNPLGITLTPDGRFAIISNDDERDGSLASLQNSTNQGGYSLSVLDTSTSPMNVVSQINTAGKLFIGLQAATNATGGYTLYAAGGGDNSIKLFTITSAGAIMAATNPASITITPTLPANQGWVSHYSVSASLNLKSVPTGFSAAGANTTFPAGITLGRDGRYLYVACNGDNSFAVIDTTTNQVVAQYPAGYFPYSVAVSFDGTRVAVSNWGVTAYQFHAPAYDGSGNLTALGTTSGPGGTPDRPEGFFVPKTALTGNAPKTSSVSLFSVPNGIPTTAHLIRAVAQGEELDPLFRVGGTHPSATAVVRSGGHEILYVVNTNDDSLGLIDFETGKALKSIKLPLVNFLSLDFDFDFPFNFPLSRSPSLKGTYPNALVASPDGKRLYVAEGGINSVAVLDTADPLKPKLLTRIPTGWWPSALALSADGNVLYIVNAKGVGEDINPKTVQPGNAPPVTGNESFSDSNFIFGTVQKVFLSTITPNSNQVVAYNVGQAKQVDDSVVPIGGRKPSKKIKTVIFIEQENKTFDSMLGSSQHFGPFASLTYNNADGSITTNTQFTPVAQNTQLLATNFATAVNYYSNSEESDAGHQFCASGTATDYTEKTLLVKTGRGLLVNKNFEPEDYPQSGYLFNNAARYGVSFKDYGELIRITGTDTGGSVPTTLDDPTSGLAGYPTVPETNPVSEVPNSDVNSKTQGLGQAYFMNLPILAVLGGKNKDGEPYLDANYPGYNFNISDQRRALEFIKDFDRMVANGTVPQFLYIYVPNDHTGSTVATNIAQPTAAQQVEDGDVGLGMIVQHIMNSPIYYEPDDNTGAAIFITYDDAQSTLDHIHEHRTPMILVSPFAKPGYIGKQHCVTASIVKTEELLLGLPPNNLDDLLATDLRDLFQPTYNGITLQPSQFNRVAKYEATPAGRAIWALVKKLSTEAPDQDSRRLGALGRLSMRSDELYRNARKEHKLHSADYQEAQNQLMSRAEAIVNNKALVDLDD